MLRFNFAKIKLELILIIICLFKQTGKCIFVFSKIYVLFMFNFSTFYTSSHSTAIIRDVDKHIIVYFLVNFSLKFR